ncbi:hypothetical protein BDW02DRAFT_131643 [Decorospora gaudefroyi]|uniref:SPT2-domain-containing protein n=1 Tax=Decorospora gaudefroyi TaxID=184978 RepID=A0A6A5KV66_9PLEO|nr:hypothetical protein BDW02DRAFT_131643 [Decorospora gaudefroyi]
MSSLKDIMSIIDRTGAKPPATASRSAPPAGPPKTAPRPVGGANGASQTAQLKRKASGPVESGQVKIQRKEAVGQLAQPNGPIRAASSPAASRPTLAAPTTAVPYRGTAAPGSLKPANPPIRKPVQPSGAATPKAAVPAPKPKPAASATGTTPAPPAPAKKGYLAMLQAAKEKDATKPVAPPIKHEPTKILTRKERLALKAEANAGTKGKKPLVGLAPRAPDPKADPLKEKRRPADVGYQGTARPAKKPVEVGYKGTARPANAPAASNQNSLSTMKSKQKPTKRLIDGYADWDELSDMDDEEEEDYASDASSDMEGGVWDVEEEEQMALKVAKKEDAEALAEEMRLKREKDERKRKLTAMAAAAKKRY